jgi:putative PEP-CTERM system histidine kinase
VTAHVLITFAAAGIAGLQAIAVLWHARWLTVRWAFALGLAVLAVESLWVGLAAQATSAMNLVDWEAWVFLAMSFLPGLWLCFSLTYARGGWREIAGGWQVLLIIAFFAPPVLALTMPDDLIVPAGNPAAGDHLVQRLGPAGTALHLLLLLAAILILVNFERTFRAAVGTMRWRIKFMVIGMAVLFVVRAYTSSQCLLFHVVDPSLQVLNSGALLVACLLVSRSLLRAGHFDVHVYPSQSVLQNSFTILVAGIYLVIVGVLAKLVAYLGGTGSFGFKAFLVLVSLVLLTVLLLSDRVRLYTRRFLSRHFQRPVYDYRSVWRTFTEGTARRVEPIELCATVVKLLSDVFQALSVTIWLTDERTEKLAFAASTSLSVSKAGRVTLEPADAAEVIGALTAHPDPIDIESSKEFWAAALRRVHPDEFRERGGNRVCVPMIAGGELLGIMILGDRVGGVRFSVQDFDLLKSVADQAATSLLNIQLSQRLAQAKQLEAFQAMSAFFVHDLKNTASTLSLMLENLPVHYEDPQFREDALRGIAKTVSHINDVISRLTVLRHELAIQAVECDLNELITDTLRGQEQTPGVSLVKELQPLPKLRLDPAQIQKVITNLVLNARDALEQGGQIRVETSQRNGFAVLAVSDNGCGMAPEFVQNSLFRPFQTTKKKGIGIGMFHCKMIVEAHHGRIEVESQLGKGTCFRVLLPVA